ncbi:hypothetical protein YTPLAS21_20260 [Candidatus Nitrosocosmicus sp.]|nr:hypothetical protein YTPLAS21_20260 [Candidatus Nitrosocosmicus sp.]
MTKNYFKGSKNHNTSVVFAIAVVLTLALSLDAVVTVFYDSRYFVNAQQQNITKTGIFNYTQTDKSGNPDWINTGNWSLTESPSVVLAFDAVINMVKPGGSEAHEHIVSDQVIPYAPLNQPYSTLIKGTTIITMNEMNIFVYFDPSKIGTHFGNQSITGSVT